MTDDIVRQSQLVTTYGPGAMLDLPRYSVIVSGLNEWSRLRRDRIDEPRLVAKLRRALEIDNLDLYAPPRHEADRADPAPVGARIFPTWFIVAEARPSRRNPQWRRRRLVQWRHLDKWKFRDDDGKRKPVVPVRFVSACRRGHIDDLNWRGYVHGSGPSCDRPLWIEERGASGDIADSWAVCDCGAQRSLYEAWNFDNPALGRCQGKRPWIGQFAHEPCGEPYRLLVRTASNAWFPQIASVISLPESDSRLAEKVARQRDRLKTLEDVGMLGQFRRIPELRAEFDAVADDDVVAEYRRQKKGEEPEDVPVKAAEFRVLDNGREGEATGRNAADSPFHAETLPRAEWDGDKTNLLAPLGKLVLVHRLREVVALLGFTRLEASSPDSDGELDMDVKSAALDETVSWLPAFENRGEGVFLSFDTRAVERWRARPAVRERENGLRAGYDIWARERRVRGDRFPGAPRIMLHSLSHMLMTAIALECGYPASSLRERVYAGEAGYGILIYTGSSDSEGTLGGLVETGRRIGRHLRRALADSRLCSNDPVCAEHTPDSAYESRRLLGAACHGCLLIAETSCEQRNDFLDRALVVPTVSGSDASFFRDEDIDA